MITVKEILSTIKVIAIGLAFVVGVSFASAAWVGPTEAPPAGNTPAPVNVGSEFQEKTGDFWANSVGVDVGYCIGSDCITEWWPDSLGGGGGILASGIGSGRSHIVNQWESPIKVPVNIPEGTVSAVGLIMVNELGGLKRRFKIGSSVSNSAVIGVGGMSPELTMDLTGITGPQTLEVQVHGPNGWPQDWEVSYELRGY